MNRVVAVAGMMAAAMLGLFWLADAAGWLSADGVGRSLATLRNGGGARPWIAVMVAGLLAADLVLPVPSSVVMLGSGALLGTAWGGGASFAGSMLASAAGFMMCRKFGRRAFERFVGETENRRLGEWFLRSGAAAVIASRPVPVLAEVVSCMAGLSDMPPVRFYLAAAAGAAPVCWIYAWAGAHAIEGRVHGWALTMVAVLSLAAFAAERYIRAGRRPARAGGADDVAR